MCVQELVRRTMLKLTHQLVSTIRHTSRSPDFPDSIVMFGKLRRMDVMVRYYEGQICLSKTKELTVPNVSGLGEFVLQR